MDVVTGKLIGGVIEAYFQIFFKNFKKEDFKLNLGASETTSTLYNLEINTDIVQEIIGIPNFTVKSVTIDKLEVKIRLTSIKKLPIVVSINRVDCVLEEPYTKLSPLPNVLEEFLKKLPNSGKPNYGFSEKIIDGMTIEIDQIRTQIITRGRFKTAERGNWTPPVLVCEIFKVNMVATNERWEVLDLKAIRKFNENKKEVHVFKVITVEKICCGVLENEVYTPLFQNLPVKIYVTMKKGLDNSIKGVSLEIKINHFQLTLKVQSILSFVRLMDGLSSCMDRRDIQVRETKIPHQALVICCILREMSIVLYEEETGRGFELIGQNIQAGMNWLENMPAYEKLVEACVPFLSIREFSARAGPESTLLLQPDFTKEFKNPFTAISPLLKTLHPSLNPYILDHHPLFYIKAVMRNPPQRPLFDKEVNAICNPLLMIIKQECISRMLEFAAASSPFLQQIQEFQSLKPNIDLSNVMVQETKNIFENLLSSKFEIGGITIMFPSSTGKFANISFQLLDTLVLSHPKLPESNLFSSGIATQTAFPGDASDFVHFRDAEIAKAPHFVKFKIASKVVVTLQAENTDEALLDIPKVEIDMGVYVGNTGQEQNNESMNASVAIKLIQLGLNVGSIKGKLTQVQYKTLLNRAYMLLPLFPLVQKIQSSFKSVEKPDVPLLLFLKVASAEWLLLDDSVPGSAIPLASMILDNLECLVEETAQAKVAKLVLQNFHITALPLIDYATSLYDPNAFVSSDPKTNLIVMRVKKAIHPPGELLKKEDKPQSHEGYLSKAAGFLKNMSYNRAFHVGDRSKVDIRISGFRSGINPNPACKIITFFLRSELNVKRIIATIENARSSLSSSITDAISGVDIVELTDNVVIDIDFNIDIKDSQFYFVRDKDESLESGNIGFIVENFHLDRHAEGKYIKKTNFLAENIYLICNKEEQNVVTPIYVFQPVSFKYNSRREWDLMKEHWIVESSGGMQKFDICVNASHSGVFMNVINGIKMQNIQDVVDCVTAYINQEVGDEPLVSIVSSAPSLPAPEDPLKLQVKQMTENLNALEDKLTFAEKEKANLTNELKQLQMKSNVLTFAKKSGFINNLEGRNFNRRFAVLSDGLLFLFESDKCITQLAQLTINNQTALELVQNIPFSIQVVAGASRLIMQAEDEVAMSQWVNEILRMQVATNENVVVNDGISQCRESLKDVRSSIATLSGLIGELGEKSALLAKIKALEEEVQKKNQLLAQQK